MGLGETLGNILEEGLRQAPAILRELTEFRRARRGIPREILPVSRTPITEVLPSVPQFPLPGVPDVQPAVVRSPFDIPFVDIVPETQRLAGRRRGGIGLGSLYHTTPMGNVVPNRISLMPSPDGMSADYFAHAGVPKTWSKISIKRRRRHHHHPH